MNIGGGYIGHQRGEEAHGESPGEDDGIAQREVCGLTSLVGGKSGFIDLCILAFFFLSTVSGPYFTGVLIKANGEKKSATKI